MRTGGACQSVTLSGLKLLEVSRCRSLASRACETFAYSAPCVVETRPVLAQHTSKRCSVPDCEQLLAWLSAADVA